MGMRVVIAGGGTGGHLFPGVAVAQALSEEGGEVLFVGTKRGIEARVVPELGFPIEYLSVTGIKGGGLGGKLKAMARLPGSFFASRAILKRFRPDVVVGVGGYASGPIVATAAMSGYPTAILEQNSVPGMTNRILGKLVKRIFSTFEDPRGLFPARKVVRTGNPIRKELVARLEGVARSEAISRRLFIFGGSQGARPINQAMMAAIGALRERVPGLEIWHQTGEADFESVAEAYREAGLDESVARVEPFIQDMTEPYAWCDLALCRAGATSLAELAAVGIPALLVPLPHAADNHQEWNARSLVDAGGAVLVHQADLEASLVEVAAQLLGDADRLAQMRAAMKTAARPQAARNVADGLRELVRT